MKLGAEIWDLDWIDSVVQWYPECGPSFSHTFGTGLLGEEGTCRTRFFFDDNNSNDSTSGPDDPYVNSPSYQVQELTYHSLVFGKSSAVTGTPATGEICRVATDLILRKDTADDYRATATLLAAGLTTIPASTYDPVDMQYVVTDPTTNPPAGYLLDTWGHARYFDDATTANVIVVDNIRPCDASHTPRYDLDVPGFRCPSNTILMQYGGFDRHILAHEFGHNCGLSDLTNYPADLDRVMYFSTDGNETLLTQSEAAAYE